MKVYTMDHRVSYREVDEERKLTLPGLIDCMQDCGVFHGDDREVSVEYLQSQNLAWVVCGYQILIDEMPMLDDRITVNTSAYNFKSCLGYRNFIVRRFDGRPVIKADSQWVLMNMKENRPARVSDYMIEHYGVSRAGGLREDFGSRKIDLREGAQQFESIHVTRPMLDTNHHVNNGQFVHISQAYLPDKMELKRFRAMYKKQAHLGDVLKPCVSMADDLYQVALLDENEEVVFAGEWECR